MLEIHNKISYGTFEEVCESILNQKNEEGKTFKETILNILTSQKESFWSRLFKNIFSSWNIFGSSKENRKILLIDETDVFFDPAFFGKLYCPTVTLKCDEISGLLKHVWRESKRHNDNYKQLR